MSDLTALDGTVLHIDDDSVTIVTGPYRHDPPRRCYVSGPTPAPVAVNEEAASVVGRLTPTTPLAQFTRPDDVSVWIKGAAVSAVRKGLAVDAAPGETVGAVVTIGGAHQAVVEDVGLVRRTVNAHGGRV